MLNLAWTIEVTGNAAKQIKRLGSADAKRIIDYLRDRIAQLDHPRQLGKPLQGSELGSYWRYRVGDYRILCELDDCELIVLVIEAGHRRKIYG